MYSRELALQYALSLARALAADVAISTIASHQVLSPFYLIALPAADPAPPRSLPAALVRWHDGDTVAEEMVYDDPFRIPDAAG